MAFKRPQARKFEGAELQSIVEASAKQTINRAKPKSTDPVNFPVFEVPVNERLFAYVPLHTEVVDGEERLRVDRSFLHQVQTGNSFDNLRSILGLDAEGYSGECPLNEVVPLGWDLANLKIQSDCINAGLDHEDREDERVKAIRRKHFSERAVGQAEEFITFPIVVFKQKEGGKLGQFELREDNTPERQTYWYHVRQATYENKWLPALEALEDAPDHPGGLYVILNFTYAVKDGQQHNKRDSARNLSINVRQANEDLTKLRTILNQETAHWDKAKSIETVIANQYYAEEDLRAAIEPIRADIEANIALYTQSLAAGAAKTPASASPGAVVPAVSSTEPDFDNVGLVPEDATD